MCLDTEKQVQACTHLFKSYSTLKSLLFVCDFCWITGKTWKKSSSDSCKEQPESGFGEENSHSKQGNTCSAYE